MLATTSNPAALRNITDERPAGPLHYFHDGVPIPPNPFDDDEFDPGAASNTSQTNGLALPDNGATLESARKSSIVAMGALPEYVEQAFSSVPQGSDAQLLAFSLLQEIGVGLADTQQYIHEDIDEAPGKSDEQLRLDYCLGRAAGLSADEARNSCASKITSEADYFGEATEHPAAASEPSVRVNYCMLRACGFSADNAEAWANIGPGGAATLFRVGSEYLNQLYTTQANLKVSTGLFPRFVGNSIPAATGQRTILGSGAFNEVELLRIIDPRTGQENAFAFKPSRPDAETGLGADLTGITDRKFFPEARNRAAVAVARTLGLMGADGVTGDAFMGIVDDQLGLLMEVAPGRPMAQHHFNMELDPTSNAYKFLTGPTIKQQLITNPAVNLAQSKILGVHSIRFDGDRVLLTGSIKDSKHTDDLEPFRNNNPSLKKAYARIEVFQELINESDCHAGNIIVSKKPDGRYCAQRIDLDQSFGIKTVNTENDLSHEDSFMAYYLPMEARYIDKELADKMRMPATRAAIEAAVTGTLASEEEIDALLNRFDVIVAAIESGDLEVIDDTQNDEGWRTADMTNPRTSLFARDGQRPAFS